MGSQFESEILQTDKAVKELTKTTDNALAGITNINKAIQSLGNGLKTGTSGFDDLTSAATLLSNAFSSAGETAAKFSTGIGGVGSGIGTFLKSLGNISGELSKVLGEGTRDTINFFDSFSKPIREVDENMFNLTKSFGMGIESARAMTDSIPKQALTDFSRAAYISTQELQNFLDSAKNTNLNIQTLTKTVSTAYGELDLYTVATAQASAAGISAGESSRYFESLINDQGMSVQAATEAMAGFSAVSSETGINFRTVASTLESATRNFQKMGMSVDFGRPILENFAKTMKDVGLGINTANDATQSLVSSLGNLSQNYGLAYLTQIRGGGGATAGGVLGTSIEMRQNLRQAEATGEQGAMAIEMAKQMKDTIASLTGGNIITLEQASKSPELQNQFYMQGQMLSQYGINDVGTQDAVLDLLSKIDQAKAMGDTQGQKELAEQLSKEIEGREASKDEMEKLNISIGSLTAEMFTFNRNVAEFFREIAANEAYLAEGGTEMVVNTASEAINSTNLSKELAEKYFDQISNYFKDLLGKNKELTSPENNSEKNKDLINENRPLIDALKTALSEVFKGPQTFIFDLSADAKELLSGPTAGLNVNTGPGSGQ